MSGAAAVASPLGNRRRRPRPEQKMDDEPPEWILDEIFSILVTRTNCNDWELKEVTQAKSAQQQVFVLKFSNENKTNSWDKDSPQNDWTNAMECGNNRLVLRIWKGGSRWWNLNRNESPLELARSEIMGYRVAHKALDVHRESQGATIDTIPCWVPKIPRVLHFHAPEGTTSFDESQSLCWAILEYVGAEENDVLGVTLGDEMKIDHSYLKGMIKIRKEFGFEEPHPRWGRVPVDEALDYARSILRQVLLPLHRHSCKLYPEDNNHQAANTFFSMVQVYRKAWNDATTTLQGLQGHTNEWEGRINECLKRLDRGITILSSTRIPTLDPVLLHLDLQPQNLIFYHSPKGPRVFSVLDWEDAAWGDPRFDLILLCRKVCANREQADALWTECGLPKLGPIEPWLRLETIHSIATMLLQSMDMVNGGRNPWETKKDLWGKLQREFTRLDGYETDAIRCR